ncbi:MAG: hypothetical protein WD044_09920 [Dongiaceae bacterium]
MEALLTFEFQGFRASIPLKAQIRRTDDALNRTELRIVAIGDHEYRLLRNLISSYLSGTLLSFDDLVAPATDQETPSGPMAPNLDRRSGWLGRTARYGTVLGVAGVLLAIAALSAYDRFYVLEAPFAATTAPRIDIRAPGEGLYEDFGILAGENVTRDTPIGTIEDAALSADLALAKATLAYQEELRIRLDEALQSEDLGAMDALTASLGGGEGDNVALLLTAESRIEELDSLNDVQRARIDALEYRISSNSIYSPCNCAVHWARGGSLTWVRAGEKLFELVSTDVDEVMVEAQIPMDFIPRLERLQSARIEFPDGTTIGGQIIEVNLEGTHRPRAGFPEWVRQDLSKATILIDPDERLNTVDIGTPVKVSFSTALPELNPVVRNIEQIANAGYAAVTETFRQVIDARQDTAPATIAPSAQETDISDQ